MPSDKVYEDFNLNLTLPGVSREEIRKELFARFLEEKCGQREGNLIRATRYRYYVENLVDGRRIFLKRPARLNKGIDIEVWVERFDGIKDKRPSHNDISMDLMSKKSENPVEYAKLLNAIAGVYSCKIPDELLRSYNFQFTTGLSPELILKVLRWLFIEQDLTYWNWQGRNMLMQGILSI